MTLNTIVYDHYNKWAINRLLVVWMLLLVGQQSIPMTIAYTNCFVPQLTNVIGQNAQEQVVRAGSRIANATKVFYTCPVRNWLIGPAENLCLNGQWQMDFPYCQPYSEYIYSRVLIVFALLFAVLIFIIYWARKASRWQRQKLCMVERNEELTPMSSTTTLNTSQL